MRFLEALANHLQTKGVGQIGRNIMTGSFPADVSIGVLLMEPTIGVPIDHELPGYVKGRFEAVVRHKDPVQGRDFADRVHAALQVKKAVWGDITVRYVRPAIYPAAFPVFESGLIEFSIVFDACFILKSQE